MSYVVSQVWVAIKDAFLMAWEVWWALVLGFLISAVVQAWVPRERIEAKLAGVGPRPLAWATGLGAASSSCSYAAIAIAKSLFQKGASASAAMAFQFASTNLVWELGLVLWVRLSAGSSPWPSTCGGLVMIIPMALLVRVFIPPRLEEARRHARSRRMADLGHALRLCLVHQLWHRVRALHRADDALPSQSRRHRSHSIKRKATRSKLFGWPQPP